MRRLSVVNMLMNRGAVGGKGCEGIAVILAPDYYFLNGVYAEALYIVLQNHGDRLISHPVYNI